MDHAQIVYISTFPPRGCGLATFTQDLVTSIDEAYAVTSRIVAMDNTHHVHTYPPEVLFQIAENDADGYRRVAEKINALPEVQLISLQHEYGIFGENFGKNVLLFLRLVQKPVIATLHTVLPNPEPAMREVTRDIIKLVESVVVMTVAAKKLLESVYGVSPEKIAVIPHGIHPVNFTDGTEAKKSLGLEGKRVLSTFGLLSRSKGIEYALDGLPAIIREFPDTVYLVIGATHPVVAKQEGTAYHDSLLERARKLGIEDHVILYDAYYKTSELLQFLQATDIYLALSQNPDQAVSGTLTYAL